MKPTVSVNLMKRGLRNRKGELHRAQDQNQVQGWSQNKKKGNLIGLYVHVYAFIKCFPVLFLLDVSGNKKQ